MDEAQKELAKYRFERANETLEVARLLHDEGKYRDSNNRAYYATFYALKAVYALENKDFKKHKTLMAEFNKDYVATEIYPREIGKRISQLAIIREQSDYDDYYLASVEESSQQIETAKRIIELTKTYLEGKGLML